MLFKNAPDLMEEFKDFLPEAMGPGAQHGGLIGIMPHPAGPGGASATGWDLAAAPSANAEGDKTAKAPASRRRKRVTDKEPPPPPQQKAGTGRVNMHILLS